MQFGGLQFDNFILIIKLIQTNLNHCCEAQSLLLHELLVERVALALIAEPYTIPTSSDWIGDMDGRAAICWNPRLVPYPCVSHHRGSGFVVASIGQIMIISVYL